LNEQVLFVDRISNVSKALFLLSQAFAELQMLSSAIHVDSSIELGKYM
jgi:hypothetical protein